MEHNKPGVDAKRSSMTLLQNTCFVFLIRFVRFLASKLAKIQIRYKSFLLHKFNMGIKKTHLMRIANQFKKKSFIQKNYMRNTFAYINKSKSASNFVFLLPILDWSNTKCAHISTFCKLWSQNHKKRLIKTKNVYYKCVLEFNITFIAVLLC